MQSVCKNNVNILFSDVMTSNYSSYFACNYLFGSGLPMPGGLNPEEQNRKLQDKEFDTMHGLNWMDFDARQYMADILRTTTPDPHSESYYPWSPYSMFFCNPLRFIDPDGRDPRDKNKPEVGLSGKMGQSYNYAKRASESGKEAVKLSVGYEAVYKSFGVKFEAGRVATEAKVDFLKAEVNASTNDLSITGTVLDASIKGSVSNASAEASGSVGKGKVSIDGNANVKTEGAIFSGSANVKVSGADRYGKVDSNSNVGVGVKLGAVKAEISTNLEKAADWIGSTISAIGTMIMPAIKTVEDAKREHNK